MMYTVKVMPLATEMAGVNMRLEAGALRELHWHKTAEASRSVYSEN
jgi:oxalate decarboxylase/phosphoglucose isomerase-like protein (cupin superfamily)